jgi:hypothetical protein
MARKAAEAAAKTAAAVIVMSVCIAFSIIVKDVPAMRSYEAGFSGFCRRRNA